MTKWPRMETELQQRWLEAKKKVVTMVAEIRSWLEGTIVRVGAIVWYLPLNFGVSVNHFANSVIIVRLLNQCEGSSSRNQFCNFLKFTQEEDSTDMFVLFALIMGTIVYLHYCYLARFVVVHSLVRTCAAVMLGQIIAVCTLLISDRPIEIFKRAFGVAHNNNKNR